MLPAGLCFAYFPFFLLLPLSIENWWTDRNADCCINTFDEENPTAKIW